MVKGNAGEPLSPPPYGYTKDPNGKGWIVDEEAAAVVRRIFKMTLEGLGTEQIAVTLTNERILTPTFYWHEKGIRKARRLPDREPHKWNNSTVITILSRQEYCGDVLNFKTYAKSFKLKKRIKNDEADMAIFKDMHEPIVDRAVWERIRDKRGKVRKRKTSEGEKNMFSGFLVCADCGSNLWYHFNQKNHEIKYFNCSSYNTHRGNCPTSHHIRVDFLEQVILQEIRRLTKFAKHYEDEFAELVMGHSKHNDVSYRKNKQKELYAMNARDRELDNLFNRMYEDNASGKIDDERFARMSKQYSLEQKNLAEKIKMISAELEKQTDKAMTRDMFISTVRKYTRAKKLSELMLNELIERIEVYHAEKVDGVHRQKLTIHYNCIGSIEIPNVFPLPQPDIQFLARKGVVVSYSPSQIAISS